MAFADKENPLWVCPDCLMFIANGDLTGLDYHHKPEDAQKRVDAIHKGADEWAAKGAYLCADSSEETDLEFSRKVCDHCHNVGPGTGDGSRHRVIALYDKAPE